MVPPFYMQDPFECLQGLEKQLGVSLVALET